MKEKSKTVLTELLKELTEYKGFHNGGYIHIDNIKKEIEKLKPKEREQILDGYFAGCSNTADDWRGANPEYEGGEDYYNQNFES